MKFKELFRKEVIVGGLVMSFAASAFVIAAVVCITGVVAK